MFTGDSNTRDIGSMHLCVVRVMCLFGAALRGLSHVGHCIMDGKLCMVLRGEPSVRSCASRMQLLDSWPPFYRSMHY